MALASTLWLIVEMIIYYSNVTLKLAQSPANTIYDVHFI